MAEVEQQNPVADPAEPLPVVAETVSTTDPDAAWAVKWGRAALAYYDNYLIDTPSRVILAVDATPARFRQESVAARRMLGRRAHASGLSVVHPAGLPTNAARW